jgi:hypothetical protein
MNKEEQKKEEKQKKLWRFVAKCFCCYETKCSPASWSIFRYREGWYLLLRFAVLCACFLGVSNKVNGWNILFGIVAVAFLLDILVANTSIAFVTRSPISNLRSFLLTFFAFTHLVVAYSIFYKLLAHQFTDRMCNLQVLYFSVVTITTLGYGDFVPQKWGMTAQLVVILELLTGLFFITGVLTRILSLRETAN